jgi:hypothetical protein
MTVFRIIASVLVVLSVSSLSAQTPPLARATPVDPIAGILEAFNDHAIVAFSEGPHGNVQAHALLLRLIRDPRFAATVNDIIVECGNARYQRTMDRFIDGRNVSDEQLEEIWQDTTQVSGVWDVRIYEEFFRAVRELNATLPPRKRLRILLGDPPIDWKVIKSADDLRALLGQRDSYPVSVIRDEVLAKGRRALVVYGGIHFLRQSLYFSLPDQRDAEATHNKPIDSIVSLLERDGSTKVFSVWTSAGRTDSSSLHELIAEWPVPSFARVANTDLGMLPFVALSPGVRMFRIVDGANRGFDPDPVRSHRVQEQFDAVLYLGTGDQVTFSQRRPELCADSKYVEMRVARIRATSAAGVVDSGAWFRNNCGASQ